MRLRKALLIAAVVLVATAALQPTVSPEQAVGRCQVVVPSDWGTFRGVAQGYGLVFEDSDGTLRFFSQLPCGLEGAPNISMEIRRR